MSRIYTDHRVCKLDTADAIAEQKKGFHIIKGHGGSWAIYFRKTRLISKWS